MNRSRNSQESGAPVRVAVAEIGSRSLRLLIADLSPATGLKPVLTRSVQTNLIGAVRRGPAAIARAMEAVRSQVRDFREHAKSIGANRIRVFGTRALREISGAGGDPSLVGEIDILSEADEAAFSLIASLRGLPEVEAAYREVMLVDQGGGSLEVARGATGRKPKVLETVSLPLGSNTVIARVKALRLNVAAYRTWTQSVLAEAGLPSFPTRGRLIIQGSTVTRCAWIAIRRSPCERYEPRRIQGSTLKAEALSRMIQVISSFPASRLGPLRASVSPTAPDSDELEALIGGVILFLQLMEIWKVKEFTVSGYGTRYGIAWSLAGLA